MRGLAWEDEPYVRLYTRRTAAWKALPWEARSIYHELLRDLDRAGCLPLDGLSVLDAVVALTGYPVEVCQVGIDALVSRGWLREDPARGCLVDPEHLSRETARRSDRQRAKEYRERRRDGDSSQNVTPPSQTVIERHDESHAVTPRHDSSLFALPCIALPCFTEDLSNRGGAGGGIEAPEAPIGLTASGNSEARPGTYSKDFLEWWGHLPSEMKQGKGDASKAWNSQAKSRPPLPEMIRAIEQAKKCDPRFLPDIRGQTYIPHAGTWIRAHGWNDECNQPGYEVKEKRHGTYSRLAPPPAEPDDDEGVVF